MADISPFAALRYDTARAGAQDTLCCPPYDIISPGQQAALEAANPYNVIRLERPLGEDCYRRAGALLRDWRDAGILRRDAAPAYYLYRMDFQDGQTSSFVQGFFARVKLESFDRGVILPHEETLAKDITDRFSLLSETFCNISPIYGLYDDPEGHTERLLGGTMPYNPPDASFTDGGGVTHSLWVLTDPAAQAVLTNALENRRVLIADGHHRYETALAFREAQQRLDPALPGGHPFGTVMMLLVNSNHPNLAAWPTHRLVRGLTDFSPDELTAKLAADFDAENVPAADGVPDRLAERPNTVGLYTGGDTVTLLSLRDADAVRRALPGKSAAYCELAVTLLHALILDPHLGISKEKLAAQTHLIYTRSLSEAYEGVRGGAFQCAFLLPPTPVGMIGRVADAGERMPQKSTYFYPKPTTGLVIHSLT